MNPAKISHINFKDLIIYEDEDYIFVNKPPYLSTLDDRNSPHNILKMAKTYIESAQVCHRIDKETSGVLVIAKKPEAYKVLNQQFEKRTVKKTYHALVDGIHNFENCEINTPIQVSGKKIVKIDYKKGKKAKTFVHTLKVYKRHTLVECLPVTGRMHQIRVHLASKNAPITGDSAYGGKPFYMSDIKANYKIKKYTEERPLIKRMALHAYELSFTLTSGKEVNVQAPYPKDFAVLLKQLEKLNSS